MLYLYIAKDSTIFHLSIISTGILFINWIYLFLFIYLFFFCVSNIFCLFISKFHVEEQWNTYFHEDYRYIGFFIIQ